MNIAEEELLIVTKLISKLIEYVTCYECCEFYTAPDTAPCGHTLCHWCWRKRTTCPCCAKRIDRGTLKLNQSMQELKEIVRTMVEAYEKLFNIKVAEVLYDQDFEGDPIKNVQNHFSAPEFPKPLVNKSKKVQHSAAKAKIPEPEKVVYVPTVSQDDWDKIEPLPDSDDDEGVSKKGKENVIGPMDIEPFCADEENQYTANNPRRSSRKRELKPTTSNSMESNEETTQNWNNVKRRRKEFYEGGITAAVQENSKQAPSTHDKSNPKNYVSLGRNNQTNISKVPFYKRSNLNPYNSRILTENNTMNQIEESNTKSNDDIEITIKVANTSANIIIKRHANMELKLNTDREIQTDPAPSEILVKDNIEVPVPLASLAEKVAYEAATCIAGEVQTPVQCEPLDEDVEMASNASHDKCVVEETPHKSSFTKVKKSNGAKRNNKNVTQTQEKELPIQKQLSKPETEDINSTDSHSDTSISTDANETVIWKPDSGTPLAIDRFVNQIQHKSTPFAIKSLDFDAQNDDVTLCAASEDDGNTTQEREIMLSIFEETLTTVVNEEQKYVIAGSSLSSKEIEILKRLCAKNNWSYVNQYTSELTHLVVKADAENKGQRTLKYMCALAASKWIISYEWVAKCMQSKEPVNEEDFEVLDCTGYPGPMKSRLATRKLFEGIKFFCKEPFTTLETHILKEMITSSGGRVVDSMEAVRVLGECSPALLLAEPEHTHDIDSIAIEHKIVPVSYEWVLNCLGSYTLLSILDLLLCSPILLPNPIQHWPRPLLALEGESEYRSYKRFTC